LEAGGNAIDAGVAGGITEAVVESDQVNFSGVAPILIYLSERGEVITIGGLGTWPSAASCELFQREHGGTMSFGEFAGTALRHALAACVCLRSMPSGEFYMPAPITAGRHMPFGW
jgi:gamma-glutamyltranspeptidase